MFTRQSGRQNSALSRTLSLAPDSVPVQIYGDNQLSKLLLQISTCCHSSLKAASRNSIPASLMPSAALSGCWRNLDGQGLTLLSVGLALLAALVLFIFEKLH
ncbi:threonylcarbamoyladenosine tRNA methylthiotransferase [Tachysurus ichikawai]